MFRSACIAAVLLAVVSLTGCNRQTVADGPPEKGDVSVAKVGPHTVWASDVKREAVAKGLIAEGEPLDVSSDMFRRVLEEVIDQKLLADAALKQKLDHDPTAQRRLAAARERILGDMLVEKVVDKAVNDNAIQALYQEQLKLAKQSEEIHARQILVATQADGDAIRKLLASGASFEALALEKSIDKDTRFNGGDMGYFTTDVMPDPYAQALKTAKVGDIVGPFQTEGGFAVLKVEDRRLEKPISLDQARPQIVRFLTYDEVRDLLEQLRKQTKVQITLKPAQEVPGAPKEPASAPNISLSPSATAGSGDSPAAAEAPAEAAPVTKAKP